MSLEMRSLGTYCAGELKVMTVAPSALACLKRLAGLPPYMMYFLRPPRMLTYLHVVLGAVWSSNFTCDSLNR